MEQPEQNAENSTKYPDKHLRDASSQWDNNAYLEIRNQKQKKFYGLGSLPDFRKGGLRFKLNLS